MKSEELMIGDWVKLKDGGPFQMEDVSGTNMFRRWTSDGEYMIPYGYDEIEPIPLTPEILEKNGFERDFEDGSLIWVDEQDVTEVVWGGTILTIHGENGHLELDTCMYVHELQRALRLCKIDKTIEL